MDNWSVSRRRVITRAGAAGVALVMLPTAAAQASTAGAGEAAEGSASPDMVNVTAMATISNTSGATSDGTVTVVGSDTAN